MSCWHRKPKSDNLRLTAGATTRPFSTTPQPNGQRTMFYASSLSSVGGAGGAASPAHRHSGRSVSAAMSPHLSSHHRTGAWVQHAHARGVAGSRSPASIALAGPSQRSGVLSASPTHRIALPVAASPRRAPPPMAAAPPTAHQPQRARVRAVPLQRGSARMATPTNGTPVHSQRLTQGYTQNSQASGLGEFRDSASQGEASE